MIQFQPSALLQSPGASARDPLLPGALPGPGVDDAVRALSGTVLPDAVRQSDAVARSTEALFHAMMAGAAKALSAVGPQPAFQVSVLEDLRRSLRETSRDAAPTEPPPDRAAPPAANMARADRSAAAATEDPILMLSVTSFANPDARSSGRGADDTTPGGAIPDDPMRTVQGVSKQSGPAQAQAVRASGAPADVSGLRAAGADQMPGAEAPSVEGKLDLTL